MNSFLKKYVLFNLLYFHDPFQSRSSVWNFCRWVADVPPRETSLSGEERGETSAVRRLLTFFWQDKLTNAHTVRGRPTLKNDTERSGVFGMGWSPNSKKNKRNFQNIQWHQIFIDAMTDRNIRSVRGKWIRFWREEWVSSLKVERFVQLLIMQCDIHNAEDKKLAVCI